MAVYLDNNATTALHEQVLEAMLPYMGNMSGNPSSLHRFGRLQRDGIEQAREQVARLAGARADQVIFTSGGTEANNLLIKGFSEAVTAGSQGGQSCRILCSAIEHMSVLQPCSQLQDTAELIAVDEKGYVTEALLLQALNRSGQNGALLVSVMLANNETGVIQTLAPLLDLCQQHGGFFHTDASQAAGKIALDFNGSGVHAMTLSAHKLYGPMGAGALVIDKKLPLAALLHGGSQEKNLRAGTENVAAIVGFGKAAEIATEQLQRRQQIYRELRDYLEQKLKLMPSIRIFAQQAERLPNTVQFGVSGIEGETLLMQLDRKAIAVSSGSACTSGKTEPSHVLKAMHVDTDVALSAIRVSFGEHNTSADVDVLISELEAVTTANNRSSVLMAASL